MTTRKTITAGELEEGDVIVGDASSRRTGYQIYLQISSVVRTRVSSVALAPDENQARTLITVEGLQGTYRTPRMLAYGATEKVTVLR